MRVKVIAPFPLTTLDSDNEIEIPENATVARLLRQIRAPLYAQFMPGTVNGVQANRRTRLHPGDLVVFLVPYSGG